MRHFLTKFSRMADEENNAKPIDSKEGGEIPKSEDAGNATEQSPKKESNETADESGKKKDVDSPSKEPTVKSPKKESKKEEKDDDDDDESDEEDEELPPGLLEQPLEVEGKREKKKVERLSATLVPARPEKKKIQVEEGSGVKLGDIPYIEDALLKTKAVDLKPLHRVLFFRPGSNMEIKKNLRQFSGAAQGKDSKDHSKRMTALNKMVSAQLKTICVVLGLERNGTKQDLLDRIEEFILKPYDKGLKVPKPKTKKRSRSKTPSSKKAKKVKTKGVKKKKKTKKEVEEDVEDDEEEEEEEEEEEDEEEEDEAEEEEEEEEEEESEDEAPKKKKVKVADKKEKKKPPPKKESKQNGKKQKASKPKDEEMSDLSDSDDDDEDDEPIAMLKKPSPPSNDEVKELVKKILDGADLETVTMKTVVKQVYAKYPNFDLSDRKDFIKDTVREIIS